MGLVAYQDEKSHYFELSRKQSCTLGSTVVQVVVLRMLPVHTAETEISDRLHF